jgi:hypothetical protein
VLHRKPEALSIVLDIESQLKRGTDADKTDVTAYLSRLILHPPPFIHPSSFTLITLTLTLTLTLNLIRTLALALT